MRRVACIFGLVSGLAAAPAAVAGELLPGPAEGRTELRFATAEVGLAPAVVKPGGRAKLEVALSPRAGFQWHEASLRPARAEIVVPGGWTAEPKELALPEAQTPAGRREFTVSLRAGADVAESTTLVVKLDYGVRPGKPPEGGVREVFFEEAKVTIELPALAEPAVPAEAVGPEKGSDAGHPTPPGGPAPPARAKGGSPLLPALFFALAAVLVLGGVAMAMRSARARPQDAP